jgi:hypothetical protein
MNEILRSHINQRLTKFVAASINDEQIHKTNNSTKHFLFVRCQTTTKIYTMKISPSAVLALAGVVATGTAFAPLSTPSRASVGVANSESSNFNTFRRPVSFLKSTETEETEVSSESAETYEYVALFIFHFCLQPSNLFHVVVVVADVFGVVVEIVF